MRFKEKVRRLGSSLLVAAMCVSMMPMSVFAMDTENKKITVDGTGSGDYSTVQEAINYIYQQEDKTGWTITINEGTYGRFVVLSGLNDLTIQAADGADVTIVTLDGSDYPYTTALDKASAGTSWYDNGGVTVREVDGITFDGLTFHVGSNATNNDTWTLRYASAVSTHNEVGKYANHVKITDCAFEGEGTRYGIFFGVGVKDYEITNCTFDNLETGFQFYSDGTVLHSASIKGNTFENCSFATHGYYYQKSGDTTEVGTLQFTGNEMIGTDKLRCKTYFEDKNDDSSIRANISGNTLEYALVGVVNMSEKDGDLTCNVLENNTMGVGSFYVEGSKTSGEVELSSAYTAPEGSTGKWILTGIDDLEVSWSPNPEGATAYVQSVIDAANAEGSKTLKFSGISENEYLYTFTWFKDAIYWESSEDTSEKTSYPGIDKYIITEEEDGEVKATSSNASINAGDTVKYQLKSNVPEDLTNYLKPADVTEPQINTAAFSDATNSGTYRLAFHDVLDSHLTINEITSETFQVTIGGKALYLADDYEDGTGSLYAYDTDGNKVVVGTYSVNCECATDGTDSLYVELDLVAIYNAVDENGDAYFTAEDFGTAEILVTYTATADESLGAGVYNNRAWVEYEDGETPNDEADVYTFDIYIYKYVTASHSNALKGAQFELYRDMECTDKVCSTDPTDNTGYAYIRGLKAGTYYLKETKAPDGYVKSDTVLEVVVDESHDGVDEDGNANYIIKTEFANSSIPHTGGEGRRLFTYAAIGLAGAAGVVFLLTRKKEDENEAE